MAEAGLALGLADFQREAGRSLGLTGTAANWTTDEAAKVDDVIHAALRGFIRADGKHLWSFLRPSRTLEVFGAASGLVSGVPVYDGLGESTITATAAKFYALMVGKTIVFGTSGNGYVISEYTSATVLAVTGDASGELTGDTFTIAADGNYDLPDDFGGIDDKLYFEPNQVYAPVWRRNEGQVLQLRAGALTTGQPRYYAVRVKPDYGATGQRWEILFYPVPDARYLLRYSGQVLQGKLTAAKPYPLGGAAHAETIRKLVVAEAEARNKVLGWIDSYKLAQAALAASVAEDRRFSTPDNLGQNSDNAGGQHTSLYQDTYPTLTFNGTEI